MRKSSLITMVVSLALVGAVGVGSTMAYLTSKQEDPFKNNFTVGKVAITTQETGDWNEDTTAELIPGKTYTKEPKVTVTADSADCRVFAKISYPKAFDEQIDTDGDTTTSGTVNLVKFNINDAVWDNYTPAGFTVPNYSGDSTDNYVSYVYELKNGVAKDATDKEFSLFTNAKVAPYAVGDNMGDIAGSDVKVQFFAIQSDPASIDANAINAELVKADFLAIN